MVGTLAIQEVLERFPEEQTPLVRELLRIIRQQQDIIDQQQRKIERLEEEIRSLKGTQEKSPPPTEPSGLNENRPPSFTWRCSMFRKSCRRSWKRKPCLRSDRERQGLEQQLDAWEITSAEQRRLVTEAALWSGLLRHELYLDTVFISDDAAAFRLLGFFHSLCWVHQERHITRLVPETTRQQRALDQTRDDIWKYYQRLKRYQKSPTPQARSRLEQDFDRLFRQKTGWPALNQALEKIHGKRDQLLLVPDRPEIPLHNNLSENDIRQYVKKRKISAGTRSDAGRRSRDTFLSLKTTCRKLGQSFWQYLQDRIQNLGQIPSLGDLIRRRAAQANNG
ncbi:MAG: transposase [Planctomycetaceae bacterium]